jgi:hypothetical protein
VRAAGAAGDGSELAVDIFVVAVADLPEAPSSPPWTPVTAPRLASRTTDVTVAPIQG